MKLLLGRYRGPLEHTQLAQMTRRLLMLKQVTGLSRMNDSAAGRGACATFQHSHRAYNSNGFCMLQLALQDATAGNLSHRT